MEEAKHERTETGETTAEEGEWTVVPKRTKKGKEGQQHGNGGAKSDQAQGGGRVNQKVHAPVDEEQKKKWTAVEEELKPKLVSADDFDWSLNAALAAKNSPEVQAPQGQVPSNSWSKVLFGQGAQRSQVASAQTSATKPLSLIGGAHVSHYKNNPKKKDWAIASLVVCSFPALEVVYEAVKEVHVQLPFISGFFSFREVEPLVALFNELKETKPELVPQIILVDGPGKNYKGFGLASHLGVLLGVPTVGVTKKFLSVDGLTEAGVKKLVTNELQKRGEAIEIIGARSGEVLGAAMRTSEGPKGQHIYIAIGHRVSLSTAVEVVREACNVGKVPQPVYFAEHSVKQELLKSDPKPKATGNAGNKNVGGNNRRNNKGGNRREGKEGGNRKEGGQNTGAFGNGKVQDGKGPQGKRTRGPKGQWEGGQGGQGGNKGPRPQGQGQGQGRGRQGGQGGNKGPKPQGQQQPGGQQGGQGKKAGGGRGGGNNRASGGSPKSNNVWTQKAPAGGASPAALSNAAAPAAQAQAQASAATSPVGQDKQQRPAGGKQQNKGQGKQGGGGQQTKQGGGGGQQKQPQQHSEKSGEKQQQPAQAEKKD